MSRGGFIGLVTGLGYCWFKSPKKIVSGAIVGLLICFSLFFTTPEYWDEMNTIKQGKSESTADLRMYYWGCGWQMFLAHPLFGVGPNNFPWVIEQYEPPEGYHGRHHGSRPAHSLYFTLLSELGLVGAVLFFGMFISSCLLVRLIA